jgi:membrane protease YdiL (CAAX protease family)
MAGAIGEYRLTGIASLVPGMNMTLLARDLLVGRVTWTGLVGTLTSTVVLVTVALAAAARIYDSERLVMPAPRGARSEPTTGTFTSAGDALVLFALAFLLLYFVFMPIEQHHLAAGLVASEWIGLLGLVALYARLSRQRLTTVLGLHRPRVSALVGATLIGCGAWAGVALLSNWVLPVPPHLVDALRRSLVNFTGSGGYLGTLALMALSPAVCEEALFRGPILRGLHSRLSPVAAVVVTGLLFGLFHLDLYRLIPASLLGIMLGFIALESGSIVPAMVAHFCNNAILVTLARLGLDQRFEQLSHRETTLMLVASVLLTASGFALLRRTRASNEV